MKQTMHPSSLLVGCLLLLAGRATAQPLGQDRPLISGPLSLAQAVQTGLKENLMVRAAQAEAQAAQQETRVMRAMTRPQISANTYLSTGNMSNILNTSPGVMPSGSLAVPEDPFVDQNLMLMVPLYTGGRLQNQVRAAQGRERAARADVGEEQAATALMVRDAYYRALLADEMVKVAQARVEAGTELVRNAQAMFETGKGIEASVQRAQAELADAQRMLTSAQNDRAKVLLELKAAMGVRLESEITLSDSLTFTPPAGDQSAALTEAARTRPSIQAARALLEAARAQVGVARGELQPQVYGSVMADAFAPRQMERKTGITAAITISFPLFDAGQRRAQVRAAEAMQQRAEAALRNLELQVASEVRQAWLDLQTAAQNYRTAQAALQAAQAAYDVIALRVQNQKSILVEQLDALAALTQARANLAQALYDHSIAAARLQRAIGRP